MAQTWFTSDLHIGHDREFIWGARGFANVDEMNDVIINNINMVVNPSDTLFILGDLMLGDNATGIERLKEIRCQNVKVILGNHDTSSRITAYKTLPNFEILGYAAMKKFGKYHFYLSHYPTITSNMEKSSHLSEHITNLYGHTHQTDNFYRDISFMRHIGVDSNYSRPVEIEEIITSIKNKINECETKI